MARINTNTVSPLLRRNLKKVLFNEYMAEDQALESCYNKNSADGPYEEWVAVAGVGPAEEKIEGEAVAFKAIEALTPKRIFIVTYALGMRATMEAKHDERYGILSRLAGEIGRKHAIRREIERASLFNGAFATYYRTGYDGKALIATDHPIKGTTWAPATTDITASTATSLQRTTSTASNELTTAADLDYATIIDLITLIRRTVDESGDYIGLTPKGLLVAPENEHTAYELLKSTMRSDTANNATSSIARHGLEVKVSPHLLDTDATMMYCAKHDLQWFDRMSLKIDSEDEFTTGDELHKGVQRFGLGFADWRGWAGTPGA